MDTLARIVTQILGVAVDLAHDHLELLAVAVFLTVILAFLGYRWDAEAHPQIPRRRQKEN